MEAMWVAPVLQAGWRVIYNSRSIASDDAGRPAKKSETTSTPSSTREFAIEHAIMIDREASGGDVIRIEGPEGQRIEGAELVGAMDGALNRAR